MLKTISDKLKKLVNFHSRSFLLGLFTAHKSSFDLKLIQIKLTVLKCKSQFIERGKSLMIKI